MTFPIFFLIRLFNAAGWPRKKGPFLRRKKVLPGDVIQRAYEELLKRGMTLGAFDTNRAIELLHDCYRKKIGITTLPRDLSKLLRGSLVCVWRCCTALAESEIRLWWWPRVCSSMKYPKRCQYKHAKQKKYHVRNWAEYNEGLRRRGDLTVWFDEEAIANWKVDKTGKPGGQRVYSDMAIETGLVVRMVYKLAYRQTEGFLHSIASLLGLGIEIPDYSTLCRRSRLLRKKLRIPKAASTQPIHLMIDSTGLRIHVGNARKPPKQRAWRKLHIAVDRETGNIVASELTASRARDATRVPALLTQIQAPLVSVAADSAYDKEAVYEAIEAHSPGRRTRVVIPPQRNATLSQNSNTAMQERDRHIRAIERHGRREWYKLSGYTKRSMVENAVYRYKAIIGPEMRARTLARQRVEHRIGCEILNKMAALGMPDTYCARVTLQPAQGGQRFAPGRATTPRKVAK